MKYVYPLYFYCAHCCVWFERNEVNHYRCPICNKQVRGSNRGKPRRERLECEVCD